MKQFILIVLTAVSFNANSQGLFSDLKPSETGYTYRTIPSYQQSGTNDTITVIVAAEVVEKFQLQHIDLYKMSLAASRKASGSLKEKSSYKVGEKFSVFLVNDDIKYSWEYYGENAYGAKKKNTMVLTFDKSGTLKGQTIL